MSPLHGNHPLYKRSLFMLLPLLLIAALWMAAKHSQTAYGTDDGSSLEEAHLLEPLTGANGEPYYWALEQEWDKQGIPDAAATVYIDAASPASRSDSGRVAVESYAGKEQALVWSGSGSAWAEYRFEVPETALYEIHVTYHPVTGEGLHNPIMWDVQLDGQRPFREASSISLYREWQELRPLQSNEDGDQIRPKAVDSSTWKTQPLYDSGGAYAQPLKWQLAQGSHVLRIQGEEAVALEGIMLAPPQQLPSYSQSVDAYGSREPMQGSVITLQAEDSSGKNDTSIKLMSDGDVRTVPRAKGRIIYNTVGGRRWMSQRQQLAWTFQVPETGIYKLGLRTLQNQLSGKASFRTIKIDGQIPFAEWAAYRFPYASSWKGTVLKDEKGEPYALELEKGEHTLSMEVTIAPLQSILLQIEALTDLLDDIGKDLISLTGNQLDKNRTWQVREELPGLPEQLELAADVMEQLAAQAREVNGSKDSVSEGLATGAKDIRQMLSHVDRIPYRLDELVSIKEKVVQFIELLQQQPLQLDEIYIAPYEQKFPYMEASVLGKLKGLALNFGYSFQSRNRLSNLDDRLLNVWVERGRDYVDLLQEMADESFTPETGIKVKVNLLPNPQLLVMANAAGKQPDVALGLTQDLPVEYAIRGSVLDLSSFPDFAQLYDRFSPGAWLPLYYDGGYYALPETQSFQALFYRKDILQQLGLQVPDTWQEVYDLLPALQQNRMNFYVNPKEFSLYFYQNGIDLYTADGRKTAIDTPLGFQAFKQWTDLFNIYALEQEVPSFYQHFRRGTMPIGIADYNTYVQLAAAAPELNGRWGVAVLPGVTQPDGSISRWAGGGQRTGVIFQASRKKEQAWTFLKWWMSTETQTQFGRDIEVLNGISFRWNTANVEAFVQLPWKREDLQAILSQWQWYKDVPNLPGGYFLEREINNAWLRTVVDGMNYRSSLEAAVLDINRELLRKQLEFGYIDENGTVSKTLQVPVVNHPWEGAAPHAY